MVRITSLLYVIPVLSQLVSAISLESTSNELVARQSIDTGSLPSACQSSCQVINTMTNCAASLTCLCTSTIGSQLQQCMSCIVSSDASVQSEADSAISSWNSACGGNLSLNGGSSSGGTTGGSTGGSTGGTTGSTTTGGTLPATTTSTSSSGGSAPNPLTGGAVGLTTSGIGMGVCIVAALAGAFMSL